MTEPGLIRVWDPFVRAFHWSQAALIALAWVTADGVKWNTNGADIWSQR